MKLEILGLPHPPSADSLEAKQRELEEARQEIAIALERANRLLNSSAKKNGTSTPSQKTHAAPTAGK